MPRLWTSSVFREVLDLREGFPFAVQSKNLEELMVKPSKVRVVVGLVLGNVRILRFPRESTSGGAVHPLWWWHAAGTRALWDPLCGDREYRYVFYSFWQLETKPNPD